MGYLYLSGIRQGMVRMDTKKTFLTVRLDYVLKINQIVLGSFGEHSWEGLCDHLKVKRNFTFTLYNSCISTLVLKCEIDIFCDL